MSSKSGHLNTLLTFTIQYFVNDITFYKNDIRIAKNDNTF